MFTDTTNFKVSDENKLRDELVIYNRSRRVIGITLPRIYDVMYYRTREG